MSRGAIVLCGGRSTRMGRDKASLLFGTEPMLSRVLRLLDAVVDEIVVVARPRQALPPLRGNTTLVFDDVPDLGPLGGIAPGLRALSCETAYVTACDVPFLRPAFVNHMFEALGQNDVAVPQAEGYVHALSAVYRKHVYPIAERLLREGWRRPVYLFEEVKTVKVAEADLRRVDPELLTLANLNTPEAYEEALARLEAEEGA